MTWWNIQALQYHAPGHRHQECIVMAKKQAKVKGDMPATETELRAVRLELPPQIHAKLRIEAAKKDVSLASLARSVVEDYVTGRLVRRGKTEGGTE
jgi:predicted HicB family RNase H-like nuclease